MNIAGIIAEYNPLHGGHAYHIEETRRRLGPDCRIVTVMSGHAVQRGDLPVMTKFARSEAALRAGADLVFELPLPSALAGAERFARGAVSVLSRLGIVTHLSFGSECGELEPLREAAALTLKSYPKHLSLAEAYPALLRDYADIFTPNNILGLEYLRALGARNSAIQPLTFARRGGAHDSDGLFSASAIRKRLLAGEPLPSGTLPDSSLEIYRREAEAGRAPIRLNETALLSYLRRLTPEDYAALPETGGGLHRRLYEAARRADSWETLIATAKTRRFTAARLRRAYLCAFFGITERLAKQEPHLRLLGIGRHGRELLRDISVPVISRPPAHRLALDAECRATDQLALCMPRPMPSGMEWKTPVMILPESGQTSGI